MTSIHHQVHKRDLLDSRVSGLACGHYPSLSCDQHNNHGVGWKHRLFHFQFRSNSDALSTSPPHKEHAVWSAAQREPCWWPPQLGLPTSSYASATLPSSSRWGRPQDSTIRSEPFPPLQKVEQEVAAAGRVRVLRLAVLSTVLAPDVSSRVVCVRTTSCEVQEGDQEGKTGTRNDNNGGGVGKKAKFDSHLFRNP